VSGAINRAPNARRRCSDIIDIIDIRAGSAQTSVVDDHLYLP
jgi:hypothetical protein